MLVLKANHRPSAKLLASRLRYAINGALRAVIGTEEGIESHVGLIRRCLKSPPLQRTEFFIALNLQVLPTPLDRSDVSGDLTNFSSTKKNVARGQRD